ncbi:MAG: sugar phosphate isomerase/epimerase [Acidobacteria bacterium]|nr:sugar phosphate isomerase/epimerase [Acidobacteriota bacterium]
MMTHTLLLHSVSYSGSWGQTLLPLDRFVGKAAELGFGGVMLMAKRPHLSVLDYGPAELAGLRRAIEAAGLRGTVLAGYTNFTGDLEHVEVPHREIQIDYVTSLARIAQALDGSLVRIFTGYQYGGAGYTPQWNMIVAALRECARRAAPLGVTIGVQNHHDMGVGYQSMHDLIAEVDHPNCRALFDAWAPALQGEDLVAASRAMGPMTVHTTIADYQLRPRYRYDAAIVNYDPLTPYVQAVPMGEGFIDYRAFLAGLEAGGFSGSIAYEMCSPLLGGGSTENLDSYARRFLQWFA